MNRKSAEIEFLDLTCAASVRARTSALEAHRSGTYAWELERIYSVTKNAVAWRKNARSRLHKDVSQPKGSPVPIRASPVTSRNFLIAASTNFTFS